MSIFSHIYDAVVLVGSIGLGLDIWGGAGEDAGGGTYLPSLDFSDARNSQYAAIV